MKTQLSLHPGLRARALGTPLPAPAHARPPDHLTASQGDTTRHWTQNPALTLAGSLIAVDGRASAQLLTKEPSAGDGSHTCQGPSRAPWATPTLRTPRWSSWVLSASCIQDQRTCLWSTGGRSQEPLPEGTAHHLGLDSQLRGPQGGLPGGCCCPSPPLPRNPCHTAASAQPLQGFPHSHPTPACSGPGPPHGQPLTPSIQPPLGPQTCPVLPVPVPGSFRKQAPRAGTGGLEGPSQRGVPAPTRCSLHSCSSRQHVPWRPAQGLARIV